MSDSKNVKLGVCQVIFDGRNLGYTKGGVEVTVQTQTHEVMVDQHGQTAVNEYIMGRKVKVKCPLAETTLQNLVQIMPGATLVETGGVKASATITVATNPTAGTTIIIGGVTITFKVAAGAGKNEVKIGAAATDTATNLAAFLTSAQDSIFAGLSASAAAAVVTVTSDIVGEYGNSVAVTAGTAGASVTLSGASLSGGVDTAPARVDVPTGVGISLLDFAKKLVLHPISKGPTDSSEDFTLFKAATAGALNYAYKIDQERVFDCEFTGYPDSVTGKVFSVGDPAAA